MVCIIFKSNSITSDVWGLIKISKLYSLNIELGIHLDNAANFCQKS
ncbi:hypothetical protein CLV51_106173 [Chitinophaga niastensis]|uniref:Uncharacterized protein n=1 Tax=Chitinophaga niastensis TaxID=536980 RepID=A0A2P8HDM6_CHINA|nr:hypothetical protein CLV51_106173 [Chitinophaga niastensis]